MLTKIVSRIKYHEQRIIELKSHVKDVWHTYETETRFSGHDDYELKALLLWRTKEVSSSQSLIEFHEKEIEWLRSV